MGRTPKFEEDESAPLFDDLPPVRKAKPKFTRLDAPLWTENKARLIAAYLKAFVMITHHGAYIDGFAAPQAREHTDVEAAKAACAAKLVLESLPLRLRHFWLCDMEKAGVDLLEEIRAASPPAPGRTVEVMHGDFNILVDRILESGTITDTMATFCLLDQRTFECEWATLQKLAAHKQNGRKIELFYFLGSGWLDRAFGGTTRNTDKIERWWGRDDWETLKAMSRHERADAFGRRFAEELHYEHVQSWPIYKNAGCDGNVMYHMIHCSDHERAPQLMNDAYRKIARPTEPDQYSMLDTLEATLVPSSAKSAA